MKQLTSNEKQQLRDFLALLKDFAENHQDAAFRIVSKYVKVKNTPSDILDKMTRLLHGQNEQFKKDLAHEFKTIQTASKYNVNQWLGERSWNASGDEPKKQSQIHPRYAAITGENYFDDGVGVYSPEYLAQQNSGSDSSGHNTDWAGIINGGANLIGALGGLFNNNQEAQPDTTYQGGENFGYEPKYEKQGMSTGAILGIVFGGLAFMGVIVMIATRKK